MDTNTQWTLASAITTIFHILLTSHAFLDLTATLTGDVKLWRRKNAAWYFLGQLGLLLIALDHAWVGVIAITMLPPPTGAVSGPALMAQQYLIGGEWVGLGVAACFWQARRALAAWADEAAS